MVFTRKSPLSIEFFILLRIGSLQLLRASNRETSCRKAVSWSLAFVVVGILRRVTGTKRITLQGWTTRFECCKNGFSCFSVGESLLFTLWLTFIGSSCVSGTFLNCGVQYFTFWRLCFKRKKTDKMHLHNYLFIQRNRTRKSFIRRRRGHLVSTTVVKLRIHLKSKSWYSSVGKKRCVESATIDQIMFARKLLNF